MVESARSHIIFAAFVCCLAACADDGLFTQALADAQAPSVDAVSDATVEPSKGEDDIAERTSADGPPSSDTLTLESMDGETPKGPDRIEPAWWGDPIEAESETWEWVPFPGTSCADGSETGLAVNLYPGATRAFIYFEGGGACWDYATCTGLVETSFHLDGFDEDDFDSLLIGVYKNMLLFDRDEPKNPFANAHYLSLIHI